MRLQTARARAHALSVSGAHQALLPSLVPRAVRQTAYGRRDQREDAHERVVPEGRRLAGHSEHVAGVHRHVSHVHPRPLHEGAAGQCRLRRRCRVVGRHPAPVARLRLTRPTVGRQLRQLHLTAVHGQVRRVRAHRCGLRQGG